MFACIVTNTNTLILIYISNIFIIFFYHTQLLERLQRAPQMKATIFVQHVASKKLSLVALVWQHIYYTVSSFTAIRNAFSAS